MGPLATQPPILPPTPAAPVYQELYWIFGFEIVATIALGLTIYYLSIAPGLERRRMQMEIYFKMRDRPTPARSGGESPLR